MTKEWDQLVDTLPPLAKEILNVSIDQFISVRVDGAEVSGFVSDTPDPRLLRLLQAHEVTYTHVKDAQELQKMQKELGGSTPIHRVVGETVIDITKVVGFYRPDTHISLCVYPGDFK